MERKAKKTTTPTKPQRKMTRRTPAKSNRVTKRTGVHGGKTDVHDNDNEDNISESGSDTSDNITSDDDNEDGAQ